MKLRKIEGAVDWISFHDEIRLRLVKHLCVFFIILMSLVAILNSSNEHFSAMPNIFVVIMCLVGLLILQKTRNFRLVAGFCSLVSLSIVAGAYFLLPALHYLTPIWMIVNIFFTYFVLGRIWGLAILISSFGCVFIYVWFFLEINVLRVKGLKSNDLLTITLEYAVAGFAIAYILFLYVKTTRLSQEQLQNNNQLLQNQFDVISQQKSEMEVMLKEIHHRVKNNLQIISSLLRLQSEQLTPEQRMVYQEAINRVSAMALIHERIYQEKSLSGIDLKNYVQSLVSSLCTSYSNGVVIKTLVNVEVKKIPSDTMVPIALILNELVTNSIKHAFKDQIYPFIELSICELNNNEIEMKYMDNGVWLEGNTATLGLEIIDAMCEQLDGKMERKIKPDGTFYFIALKLNSK